MPKTVCDSQLFPFSN